jgi:porin
MNQAIRYEKGQDQIVAGFSRISINNDVNDTQIRQQDEEYNTEIYYGVHATNWLTIRPNVQYIRHVGAYKDGENAWVGGIKFQTAF